MPSLKKIRWYHLFLAVLVTLAYLTGDEESGIHRLIGYGVAAALSVRLLLALFMTGPFGWRRLVPQLRAPASLSIVKHPAISRILILLILSAVAGTATTGVLMDNGASLMRPSLTVAESEGEGGEREGGYREREGEDGESGEDGILSEVHELFANLIIILVGAHIAYLVIFRLPMAKFMLFWPTGKRDRKPNPKGLDVKEEPLL